MPAKSKKSKARKSSKPAAKKSGKSKMKKSAKPKKRVMAKKRSKPRVRAAAIASQFSGSYSSSVEEISAMNGTLQVPNPSNSNQVVYTLDSDGSSFAVAPSFGGTNSNLISFSFSKGGVPYSYVASSWTPAPPPALSGGTWTGTATGPSPMAKKGDWTASTG